MKRKEIDLIKAEVARLLQRIDEMERLAGWTRYSSTKNSAGNYDHATSKPHPEDKFYGGKYAAAPTTQPAPQQEAQEPAAWQGVHDQTDLYYTKPVQADVRPLYAAPQPAPPIKR